MFNPFFSPLLKTLERILKSRSISRLFREKLALKLVDAMIWLVVLGATVTTFVVLINALR
jgi:hypothetical protein